MFIKFPSIGQFRHAVRNLTYKGATPVVKFIGTVKLHGCNIGILWDRNKGLINAQSRNEEQVGNGVHGCVDFVNQNIEHFKKCFAAFFEANPNIESVAVYGELCGEGINKGAAICNLSKRYVVFDVAEIKDVDGELQSEFLPLDNLKHFWNEECGIWNTMYFEHYEQEVDFSEPEKFVNGFVEITDKVEQECPVAAYFGVYGTGEGVVWRSEDGKYRFKVKGEKHSISKVRTLAAVDVEKLETLNKFVEYSLTENRMKQGLEELKQQHGEVENYHIPDFCKWVVADIIKEELDTMQASDIDIGAMRRSVAKRSAKWFLSQL